MRLCTLYLFFKCKSDGGKTFYRMPSNVAKKEDQFMILTMYHVPLHIIIQGQRWQVMLLTFQVFLILHVVTWQEKGET